MVGVCVCVWGGDISQCFLLRRQRVILLTVLFIFLFVTNVMLTKCLVLYLHIRPHTHTHTHLRKATTKRTPHKKKGRTKCLSSVKESHQSTPCIFPFSIWATALAAPSPQPRQATLSVVLMLVKHYSEWPNSIVAVFSLAV